MCKIRVAAFLLVLTASASAGPLDALSNDQKTALGQLFGGYSESFLCNKQVDFDVAAAFMKSKLTTDTLSLPQAAQLAHIAVAIHLIEGARLQKQQPPPKDKDAAQKAIKAHCMQVEHSFGPQGEVIPGLLK